MEAESFQTMYQTQKKVADFGVIFGVLTRSTVEKLHGVGTQIMGETGTTFSNH